MDRPDLKIEHFKVALKEFLKTFAESPQSVFTKANTSSSTAFWYALLEEFPYILDTSIEDILSVLYIFLQNPSQLPESNFIIGVFELLVGQVKASTEYTEISLKNISLLFKIRWFCFAFLQEECLAHLFVQFINEQIYEPLCLIIQQCDTAEFSKELSKFKPEITILLPIRFIACKKKDNFDTVPTNIFVLLCTYLFKWIGKSFTPQVMADLLADGVIYDVNQVLSKCSAKSVLGIYESLIEWDPEYPIHPMALKVFHQIYVLDTTSTLLRVSLLEFIAGKSISYNQNFALQANISGWFLPEICSVYALFSPFTEMLRGIARVDTKFIIPVFLLFVEQIVPPIKSDMLLNQILDFLLELLSEYQMPNVLFNNDLCLEKLLLQPQLKDFAEFLQNEKLQEFLMKMFAGKTIGWQPYDILRRLTDSGKFMKQEKINLYLIRLFAQNFNPGILSYLIKNLEDEYIEGMIYSILTPWRYDIVQTFNSSDCFAIVESKIGESIKWTRGLLKFINTIVTHESDHFFDEWVIQQPASSPVFSLKSEDIAEFVVPSLPSLPLSIPSLVPLCEQFSTNSFYNLYMLGAYALPVYRKLGIKYDSIKNIKEIANRFIYPEDFMILAESCPLIASNLLVTPPEPYSLFEFFSHIGPGWLEPANPTSCVGFCFKIRFQEESLMQSDFVTFNNNISLSMCDGYIFSPNNDYKFKIELKTWYQILICMDKSGSSILVYIDSTEFCSFPSNADTITLKEIGNSMNPGTAFLVQNNVDIINDYETLQNYTMPKSTNIELIPKKSCALSHFFSAKEILNDPANIVQFFELFNKSKSHKTDILRIISQIPNMCEINEYTFFSNFVKILKENKEFCETGWFTEFAFSMYWVPDIKSRTRVFLSIISDYELWDIYDDKYTIEFLQNVFKYISTYNDKLDIAFLLENHALQIIYNIIFCSKSTKLSEQFIRLFLFLLQFAPVLVIKRFARMIASGKLWMNIKELNFSFENIKDFILNFDTESYIFSLFIDAMTVFEQKKNTEVFTLDDLLSLILTTSHSTPQNLLEYFLARNPDNEFFIPNMPLFCFAIKKFPTNIKLWNFLYSRLFDQPYNVLESEKTFPIKRPSFIYPIFTLIISLFDDQSDESLMQKISSIFIDTFSNQCNILITSQISNFAMLLRHGTKTLGTLKAPDYELPPTSYISKTDISAVKEITDQAFPEWLAKFVESTNFLGKTEVPEPYINFMAKFLSKLIVDQAQEFMTKSPRAFTIIIEHALPEISNAFLLNVLPQLKNISKKFITIVLDNLLYFYVHNPHYFENNDMAIGFIEFMKENNSNMKLFIQFTVLILPIFDEHQTLYVCSIFQDKMNTLQINYAIMLLYSCYQKKLKFDDAVRKSFLKHINKLISKLDDDMDILCDFLKGLDDFDFEIIPDNVFASLSNLRDRFIKELEVKIENINIDYRPDAEQLLMRLYKQLCLGSVVAYNNVCSLCLSFNQYLKNMEKFISTQQFLSNSDIKSYRRLPFAFPMQTPSVVYPSPFPIYSPSDKQPDSFTPVTKLFGFSPTFDLNLKLVEYLPQSYFKYSGMFNVHKGDIMILFKMTYGSEYTSVVNCRLNRLDIKVPCIFFASPKQNFILTGASLVENEIVFTDVTPSNYTTLYEAALLGEFGEFRMFCGRVILKPKGDMELFARRIPYNTEVNSFEFFSCFMGNYILDFEISTQFIGNNQFRLLPIDQYTQKWKSNEISTFEYLNIVNFFANRSYSELASYPVYPRTLTSMSSNDFRDEPYRDLNTALQLLTDSDPQHKNLLKRFQQQKFFFAENISNPIIVSSLHVRIIPFCRYQWMINEGWDAGDRNFTNVPFQLQISPKTLYEITPELFTCPEYLVNLNNFCLKNKTSFDVVLPNWAPNAAYFIALHRSALESKEVRQSLHTWIDLTFGSKQRSKDDYNVYNPLAYFDAQATPDKRAQQKKWMELCGQVPFPVFAAAHPETSLPVKMGPAEIKFVLDYGKPSKLCVSQILNTLYIDGKPIMNDPEFAQARSASLSDKNYFIAINFSTSIVKTFFCTESKLVPLASLHISSPRMTTILDSLLVAATASDGNLTFWSICSGQIIKQYSISQAVQDIKVDQPTNTFFIAYSNSICQYSPSGFLLSTIALNARVKSVATFGIGFSIFDRYVLAGCTDGTVKIYVYNRDLQPVFCREVKVAKLPILKLVLNETTKNISVFTKL